jgi:hypothetical protein
MRASWCPAAVLALAIAACASTPPPVPTRVIDLEDVTPSAIAKLSDDDKRTLNAVASYIATHEERVVACFAREAMKGHVLAGEVVMRWTIDATGATSNITVSRRTLDENAVSQCLVGAIAHWQLPIPYGGPVTVNVPFAFGVQP